MRWMDFVDALLSPLGSGLLLALVLWLGRRRLPRFLFAVGIAIEALCFVLATPVGANALVAWQEHRVPRDAACAAPVPNTIVVLSGGMRRDAIDANDFGVLNVASLQRTLSAVELARRVADPALVLSGGGRNGRGAAQASIMAEIARGLGIPAASIRAETASMTTWENARDVRALDPPVPARIWLVTSATHMPRALLAFRAAGFDACPYAGDYRAAPFAGVADFLPTAGAIANSDAVLHEWVGEIVYRLK